jgi:hypothetical protein
VTTKSRETFRDAFATMLSSAITGGGQPVQAVYNYFKGTLSGESPVVMVTSGPILRKIAGMGTQQFVMRVGLNVIVMVAELPASTPGNNEQAVDDLVDAIEAKIADVVSANQNNGSVWNDLKYTDQPSEPMPGKDLDGHPYVVEIIRLEALLYD